MAKMFPSSMFLCSESFCFAMAVEEGSREVPNAVSVDLRVDRIWILRSWFSGISDEDRQKVLEGFSRHRATVAWADSKRDAREQAMEVRVCSPDSRI